MYEHKLDDYDTDELEQELDETFKRYNDWSEKHGCGKRPYEYELGTHNSGIAVDMRESGGACKDLSAMVCKPALRCGFVTTGVKILTDRPHGKRSKTRVFLRDLSETDVSIDP